MGELGLFVDVEVKIDQKVPRPFVFRDNIVCGCFR